jgi:hypothetical protein
VVARNAKVVGLYKISGFESVHGERNGDWGDFDGFDTWSVKQKRCSLRDLSRGLSVRIVSS